jgi:hypothetical protein
VEYIPAIGANIAIVTAAPIPVAALSRGFGRNQCWSQNCGGGESKHDFASHGVSPVADTTEAIRSIPICVALHGILLSAH